MQHPALWARQNRNWSNSVYLGINAFFHDSSACLADEEGHIIAAAEEERFSRRKKDGDFPFAALSSCMAIAKTSLADIRGIGFSWSPYLFLTRRILWNDFVANPVRPSVASIHFRKLRRICFVSRYIKQAFATNTLPPIEYFDHHLCHAASAYFPSPFDESAYVTIDGRGEFKSLTWGIGRGPQLSELGHCNFPHSLGKLYSAISRFLGFHGPEKDGTVMALAALGRPRFAKQFHQLIQVQTIRGVQCPRLRKTFFNLQERALPTPRLERLFGIASRERDDPIEERHADIAASLQKVTEDFILNLLNDVHLQTKTTRLTVAGGVALNSVVNGMILDRTPFKEVFIQPAAHDGGTSLGAAMLLYHASKPAKTKYVMSTAALGPSFTNAEVDTAIKAFERYDDIEMEHPNDLVESAVQLIIDGAILGWFMGRLEFGPRALGQRSIFADPRSPSIQDRLNRVKRRQSFRPFAAMILKDHAHDWFHRITDSKFMLLVDHLHEHQRSQVPGVQHVDGSVRLQTVDAESNPLLWELLHRFCSRTKIPMLINTSLNVRGEPLACTPRDAILAFNDGPLDALVMENRLIRWKSSPFPIPPVT